VQPEASLPGHDPNGQERQHGSSDRDQQRLPGQQRQDWQGQRQQERAATADG
jgi:hypothetical protein